jgi:lysozyme family protein
MKDNFVPSLGFVLRHECVFEKGHDNDLNFVVVEDVPGDSGGLTKFGIDAADHPGIDIRALTLEVATEMYRAGEWTACFCDGLPEKVDTAVFDCAVNCGCAVSAILLQRAINARGFKVVTDGEIGQRTAAAAMAICAGSGGADYMVSALLAMRRTRYENIVLAHPSDAKFLKGWLNRVDDLETFLKGQAPAQ